MNYKTLLTILFIQFLFGFNLQAQESTNIARYSRGDGANGESRTAEQVGMDAEKLKAAVEFAKQSENTNSKKLADVVAVSFATNRTMKSWDQPKIVAVPMA